MDVNFDALMLVAATGLMALIFVGFVVWGWRTGQYRDLEGHKFDLDGGEDG